MRPVNVIIAARNEAAMLGECLQALQKQDYPAEQVTIFVVDNGSSDDTSKVAAHYGCRVLSHPQPGAAGARNLGVAAGSGDLLAFLDAHCVVSTGWIRQMADTLGDADVGACQGAIVSRGLDSRVDAYVTSSARLSNEGVLDDTVRAKYNLYPWILSGNSMVRRDVFTSIGGFNPHLSACEDVDLGWRIVLAGFRLVYANSAVATHWDSARWGPFLFKSWRYGRGAAQLANLYASHGARRTLRPRTLFGPSLAETSMRLLYSGGHWTEMAAGLLSRQSSHPAQQVPVERRPTFVWREQEMLRISRGVVFWLGDDGATAVDIAARHRYVLDGVSGFIWRQLARRASRGETIEALVKTYGIAPRTAEADLDDFIDDVVGAGLVETLHQESARQNTAAGGGAYGSRW